MKKFITGFILGSLLFSIIPVYAITQKTINVSYDNIKISVNGNILKPDTEPFMYNNRIFVPIGFIAEALGMDAQYNKTTDTVEIKSNKTPILTTRPTPVPLPMPSATPSPIPALTYLNSASALKTFLERNYSSLTTDLGTTKFTFEIVENKTTVAPFDYLVYTNYNYDFFYKVLYDNTISKQARENTKAKLKAHQEKLAKAIIAAMPSKKLVGKYNCVSVIPGGAGLEYASISYCNWANFDGGKDYDNTSPSTFRWQSAIDEDF
jgi:hypothetical protein